MADQSDPFNFFSAPTAAPPAQAPGAVTYSEGNQQNQHAQQVSAGAGSNPFEELNFGALVVSQQQHGGYADPWGLMSTSTPHVPPEGPASPVISPVPSTIEIPPVGAPPPVPGPPVPANETDPFGVFASNTPPAVAPPPAGMPPPPPVPAMVPTMAVPSAMALPPAASVPPSGAMVPTTAVPDAMTLPPAPAPPSADPFGYMSGPPQQQVQQQQQQPQAIPPNTTMQQPTYPAYAPAPVAPPPPPPPTADSQPVPPPYTAEPENEDDFWAQMGFGLVAEANNAPTEPTRPGDRGPPVRSSSVRASFMDHPTTQNVAPVDTDNISLDERGIPSGGTYYKARIATSRLGAMFFSASELKDTLFLRVSPKLIDALGERPIVGYTAGSSAAYNAGIQLGHILLTVNEVAIDSPKRALEVLREAPRPMVLECCALPLSMVPITVAENQHMVKYDTKETTAPKSNFEWKPKYVVVGGIVSRPYLINMYRTKAEYDKAIVDIQSGRPVSVKVKQFDLRGARILSNQNGDAIRSIKYMNKESKWHFIVVMPRRGDYPIKISHPLKEGLTPVREGIERVLAHEEYGIEAYAKKAPQSTTLW